MADTQYSKYSHTNGPSVKIYDLTGTASYPTGPYAEGAVIIGWDPIGLQFLKVKVDSSGALVTSGTSTTIASGSTTVVQGTAANLNATVVGTVTTVPSGTQNVNISGGTSVVTQGTAANLNATVVGTVTNVPSGTQTTTPVGTQTVAGTVAATQSGVWTTTVTQGTASNLQATVVGTVTNIQSGTATHVITGIGTSSSVLDQTLNQALPVRDTDLIGRLDSLILAQQDLITALSTPNNPVIPQNRIGPSIAQDGMLVGPRAERSGALITADGHARYQEAVLRGNVFTGLNALGGITGADGVSPVGCIVLNPANSGKNLVILAVSWAPTVVGTTSGIINAAVNGTGGQITLPTGTTAETILANIIGAPVTSVARVYSTATMINAAVGYLNLFTQITLTTSAAGFAVIAPYIFMDGLLVLTPGSYINVRSTGLAGVGRVIWEEVSI